MSDNRNRPAESAASPSILEIRSLQKAFSENAVLKDISLSVERGNVISIIGPSGSGKSTLLRMSKVKIVSAVTRFIITILRGTPLMLQLLAVTYGPYYLFGFTVARNKLIPVVIAFAINYAAYFAEIYRGGIESIPVGQYEAAEVLGYSKFQTFMRIILPQVIKRIMPSVTNEVVTLVKDTSMAFTVSYQEMFTIGKQIANSQTSFVPFLVAGAFYYIFNVIVDYVMGRIEKRLDYYR